MRLSRRGEAVLPIEKRFGLALREKREKIGLSQEKLAEMAGMHRNYVGLLERGVQVPSIRIVEKLAQALGTTMSGLLKDIEKRSESKQKELS
jgi:transcriptional regulator with XRE-family HTH domain